MLTEDMLTFDKAVNVTGWEEGTPCTGHQSITEPTYGDTPRLTTLT